MIETDVLTYEVPNEVRAGLVAIPWPNNAPTPKLSVLGDQTDAPMPESDVLVVTWTTAEAQALADVLTPGHPSTSWVKSTRNFAADYLPHLSPISPAREEGCAATWWPTSIGSASVLCVKSNLHLSTDDATLPVRALWKQMIEDVKPKLIITTGTAGGIGAGTVEGDVLITNTARFDCRHKFAKAPFASQSFTSDTVHYPSVDMASLLKVNAARLDPVATRAPHVWGAFDVVSTDFFAFDTQDDHYGLRAYDGSARMVEMGDAVLGLVCSEDITDAPPWLSIRNASDPQIASSVGDLAAQTKQAGSIYQRLGYWTTVGSAIVVWAAIVTAISKGTFT